MSGIVGTLHGSRESDVAVVGDRNVAAKKGIDALIVDWEEGRDIGANRIQSRSFDRQGSPEVHSAGPAQGDGGRWNAPLGGFEEGKMTGARGAQA